MAPSGGATSTPNRQNRDTAYTEINPGPYIAIVKDNVDESKMGGLKVLIPSLAGRDFGFTGNLIDVSYLMPFYGSKSTNALAGTSRSDTDDYQDASHSYGMWMVPPDIDTKVLVIFVEGKISQGYWFGCVQEPYTNHMIPGIAASADTIPPIGGADNTTTGSKMDIYGSDVLPAGELNRELFSLTGAAGVDKIGKPIHPFAETLRQEGLSQDNVRGTTTSSARRESPSAVFGISTPGRVDTTKPTAKLGPIDALKDVSVVRNTGHTFAMDDGDNKGDNQLIRLRSASGHQILLHDTKGVVYLANGSGNVWMEFSANGAIDIYAGGGVNIRSRGDMNFHSDTNINMFARKQIKLSSVGKLVIDGGAVQTYADYDVQSQSRYGSITNKAPEGNIVSYAGLMQLHMATGQTHLTGSQVHFNSIPTSPNIVATYERTTVQDTAGTGTLREAIPDVNPANKYTSGPLVVAQNTNISMSGMRVPTHEPYPFHFDKVVTFVGTDPSALSNTPGTPEFIAQRNRTSDNPVVRIGQFQADLQYRLQKDGVGQIPTAVNKLAGGQSITDVQKIQQAANTFAQDYSKTYNLKDAGPFNISPVAEGVSSTIQQTVSSLTGSNVNLLKNQVFVNQGGVLYSAGNLNQGITSSIQSASGALGTVTSITTTAGNVLNTYNAVKDKIVGQPQNFPYGYDSPLSQNTGGISTIGNTTDNTSVSTFISTGGPFGGGNIFGSTPGGGNVFSAGGVTGLPTIPGLPGISIPGLGQVNQVLGLYNQATNTYNVVNKVYKNVFGSDITSITNISSLTDSVGNELASITSSIGDALTPSALGDLAGFTSDAGIIADIGFSI
jgi:hypothetical protein